MQEMKITLAIIWVAVMLTYLLGDVIRIFAGHFTPGELQGVKMTQGMALTIAGLMVIPILMVVLSLVLPYNINRWANIILAALWFIFNLVGLPGYEGHYDRFLLAVSMVFNLVTIWFAWRWVL
ncbi:MAG: hypothetical protein DWQ07_11080 [Chloroflexi bacterium]|nr:MAG: hypothetical protein DWQ07_11080 [Chloroflexota bacterium]MBL1192742.1 hypothetical protein [Chloroflexota bacterium]NOH10035.1 hypothetical protein [Chloroflexota bacterium]